MLRLLLLVPLCVPVLLAAQAPSSSPRPAAPAARQAAPRPAPAPAASTRKPAPAPAPPVAPATPPPLTDEQKVVYAIGLVMHRSLGDFDLSAAELEIIRRALADAAAGAPAVSLEEFVPRIDALVQARRARVRERDRAASLEYLVTAAAEPGAVTSPSGLIYREVVAGTGATPSTSDFIRVHYRGTLVNGTEFDSSYSRNAPGEFAMRGVIACWTEALQRMRVGGKSRLVCPAGLAYGEEGNPNIPGGSTLIFDVELVGIIALR